MPTAACGIDCDVCRLHVWGVCSSCGPGGSREAAEKIAVQNRLFGMCCSVLGCAHTQGVAHCPRDCDRFPCESFQVGPYPYSRGYLNMQERRRKEGPPARSGFGKDVQVPPAHWEALETRDLGALCLRTGAEPHPPEGMILPFLQKVVLVDVAARCLREPGGGQWERVDHPLLELLTLVYLLNARAVPTSGRMVSVKELKDAHFFQGPHELPTAPLLERYGSDAQGFREAGNRLGGTPMDLADASFRLLAFPRVPLYWLLWEGDAEFRARVSVLFDRTVELHLPADAVWGLVGLVSHALLHTAPSPG